jgi:hypothetical protein
MFTLTIFKDLISKYSNWNDLSKYLKSSEGGSLIITSSNKDQVIIRYNKNTSVMTVPHVKWFRSVVWDTLKNRPVSISSPKAENDDPFSWKAPYSNVTECQDYLEGVTINCFTLKGSDDVVVTTRTKFGAAGKYYSNRSFNDLLKDVFPENSDINILKTLYKKSSNEIAASFITILLQHPEHRVVEKVKDPKLYYIHSGNVLEDGSVELYENNEELPNWISMPSRINLPSSEETISAWFEALNNSKNWEWKGVVFKDGNGSRWRINSSVYRMIRSLRGATPRMDERFFNLRKQGLVKTYLTYYPEESKQLWKYETWLRDATNNLYSIYIKVNKAHSIKYNDVEFIWKPHVTALHNQFLTILKPANKSVLKEHAIEYMNNLPVPRLLYLMNYSKRPQAAQTLTQTATTETVQTVDENVSVSTTEETSTTTA